MCFCGCNRTNSSWSVFAPPPKGPCKRTGAPARPAVPAPFSPHVKMRWEAVAACLWALVGMPSTSKGAGGISQMNPSESLSACSYSAVRQCLRLRGGGGDERAELERHEAALRSMRMSGAQQWAELGYYQENYWGGPCPEEDCRCRDPNAEPPTIPLPPSVHPSVLHEIKCICPACQGRRVRMQQLAAERAVEEAREAEKAAVEYDEMRKVMRQGEEDGSVYSLHGSYDTDTVPDAIMGSVDDPLSPLGVCARHPPRAADAIEQLMQQEIAARDVNDPANVPLLIQYAQFLYDTRGDRVKAALLADRVRQMDPGHWWINIYGEKYLAALDTGTADVGDSGFAVSPTAAGAPDFAAASQGYGPLGGVAGAKGVGHPGLGEQGGV